MDTSVPRSSAWGTKFKKLVTLKMTKLALKLKMKQRPILILIRIEADETYWKQNANLTLTG